MWRLSTDFLIVLGLIFTMCVAIAARATRSTAHGWEVSAIASLRNIASVQEQFRAAGHVDRNGDGEGEYGCFQELTGRTVLRGGSRTLSPPVLSGAFRTPAAPGVVKRGGYYFSIWLADRTGLAVRERTVAASSLVAVIAVGG